MESSEREGVLPVVLARQVGPLGTDSLRTWWMVLLRDLELGTLA